MTDASRRVKRLEEAVKPSGQCIVFRFVAQTDEEALENLKRWKVEHQQPMGEAECADYLARRRREAHEPHKDALESASGCIHKDELAFDLKRCESCEVHERDRIVIDVRTV